MTTDPTAIARAALERYTSDWHDDTDHSYAMASRHAVDLAAAVRELLAYIDDTDPQRRVGTVHAE